MNISKQLPQNDPMLIAFQKLKKTPEYKNAVNWTIKAENEEQADGELWFGFSAGYAAAASKTKQDLAEGIENAVDDGEFEYTYAGTSGFFESKWIRSLINRLREEAK